MRDDRDLFTRAEFLSWCDWLMRPEGVSFLEAAQRIAFEARRAWPIENGPPPRRKRAVPSLGDGQQTTPTIMGKQ
jgi:hypothetical protein